jgi:hypothetical protein
MARKKKTTVQEDYVSNDSFEKLDVYTTPKEDTLTGKVKTLREKGYSNNQIASMLMIHVQKINSI